MWTTYDIVYQINKEENVHRFVPKGELLERERERSEREKEEDWERDRERGRETEWKLQDSVRDSSITEKLTERGNRKRLPKMVTEKGDGKKSW